MSNAVTEQNVMRSTSHEVKFCFQFALNIILLGGWLLLVAPHVASSPSFKAKPQQRSRARQVETAPTPEAVVIINEQLVNSLLDQMFTLGQPPGVSLIGKEQSSRSASEAKSGTTRNSEACDGRLELMREADGVRTAIRFANNRITAPLAFRASYETIVVGCLRFHGTAMTDVELAFDRERQRLVARVAVRDVRLSNAPQLLSSLLRTAVQEVVEGRLNPVEVFRLEQLEARVPQAISGAGLKLRARDVRPEIGAGELRLHIFYEVVR